MNGFRSHSRDAQGWRYQRTGNRAVSLELRGFWKEAAETWLLAARVAPRTDWQQFARQRAEHCQRRCRGRRVMKKQ
ncbi:TPA: ANR family transcriptional regulator [Escherichia coli]|uniref:ANR family transcriptional regulator n=1 Tax=Escherichia coli TaxID=562 RepID=UPI00127609CB|nr:ANR family transcriptional regulator [Escherichia coli]ECI7569196.1 ANR family transcriptional regulator [Salmonella enterica subsp. enterica]MCH6145752.1 ANR family transcriptional regulator [Escherichia coli]HAH9779208.1 ANR family transcriptional regulator [Escherichia coli]HBJ0913100.1 ANR family transcriptional regulator [Escherichia coli]